MTAVDDRGRSAALEELLLRMWRIRAFEMRAMELFEEKLIRGSVHPYIGMEAIAVGVCAALRPDDYITSTHRGHGHCIAKGLDPADDGRDHRPRGRLLPRARRQHAHHRDRAGHARRRRDRRRLVGDRRRRGARAAPPGARRGRGLLLRRRRRQPGDPARGLQPRRRPLRARRLRLREQPVGDLDPDPRAIDGSRTSPTARPATASRAWSPTATTCSASARSPPRRCRARAGEGPTLIEAKSYRITPHSAATPNDLRPPEELDALARAGPDRPLSPGLAESGSPPSAAGASSRRQAVAEVEEAVEFALASPAPRPRRGGGRACTHPPNG